MSEILSKVRSHNRWRLEECLNLIPSENVTSPQVREILSSDLGHRYTLPFDQVLHGVYVENAYRGTKYFDEIEEIGVKLARDVFGAKYASLKPLSGHVSGLMALIATCKKGDEILTIRPEHGGYDGYWKEYMPHILGLEASALPFSEEEWNLDHDECAKEILQKKPALVVIGASFILFPYDLRILREACDESGSVLGYDASHVLGLMGGGEFQKPLQEGADIVYGSTHKSFFGPQGGMILTNREDLHESLTETTYWKVMDNTHGHRIGALAQALLEMKEFGGSYARQIITNSKALGQALDKGGFPIKYKEKGYTDCHQMLVDAEKVKENMSFTPHEYSCKLEESNIILGSVGRVGTCELTRMGADVGMMEKVAELILRTL
ncbi:MAG: serine hydroxymethyltransferase, partial [Methanobacteriota archaeon]